MQQDGLEAEKETPLALGISVSVGSSWHRGTTFFCLVRTALISKPRPCQAILGDLIRPLGAGDHEQSPEIARWYIYTGRRTNKGRISLITRYITLSDLGNFATNVVVLFLHWRKSIPVFWSIRGLVSSPFSWKVATITYCCTAPKQFTI